MKKQLLLLIMMLLPLVVWADAVNVNINGIYYNLSGSTAEVTSHPDKYSGSIVIPSSVKYGTNNYTVTGIGNLAFYQCTELTELTIPSSITYIGDTSDPRNAYVFQGCNEYVFKKVKISDLEAWCKIAFADNSYANPLIIAHHLYLNESEITDLVIPNTITTLGTFQFESCHGITSLTIPSTVTNLGLATFYDCRNLTTVNIAPGLTTIGVNMFFWCDKLTSISIPNTVTTIQHGAFANTGLTSIEIPNSVTSIEYNAFQVCKDLTSITIPNSVTSIGERAFLGCSSLGSIEIPNSVTSIGDGALRDCYGLKSITVDAGNTVYDSRGGCNAIINTTSNTLITGCSTTTIPNSVTSIGDYAFSGCSPTSIEIPNSVTSIGIEAFSGSGGLTSVSIPNSVTSIGYAAFQGCSRLTSIEIPNTVTSIASSLFMYCSGLTSIEIPNSVTSIGGNAFYQCSGLTSITIPNSVNKIGADAFYQCHKLNSVTIPNSVTSIEEGLFMYCTSLTSINIPYSVNKIGKNAFYGCSNLNSVSIERIKPIAILSGVFTNRTNATLYVPSGSKELYEAANYWKEFKEIVEKEEWAPININFADAKVKAICIQNWDINGDGELANQEADIVTNLGEVFAGNTSITSFNELRYFRGLTSLERKIFLGCSSLTSITIPSSVNNIEYGAFAGCRSLISIAVDANNSSYDSRNGCNAIIRTADNVLMAGCSKTIIENSVKAIAPLAFAGYDNIVSIEIPNSVEDIAPSAFDSCTGLTTLTLPNSVKYIWDRAFYNCTGLSEIHFFIESPFTIRDDVFWSWNETDGTDDKTTLYENIKLYVPKGKVDAYKATDGWKNFKNILEMADATDVSTMNNVIYIEPMEEMCGSQATISLKMKNTAAIRGFQFDLYLPDGVTVVKSSKGRIQGFLSEGRLPDEDEHSLTFSEQADGAIRFLCSSQYDETFTGNDGEIATLRVNIANDMADGDYPLLLKNIKLTETDISKYYETPLVKCKLTIKSYILGDINSDGEVDVSDYTGVANHIHGNTPESFVAKAGDVDGSGTIDVSDYTGIANIIHTGSIYGNNASRGMSRSQKKVNTDISDNDNVIYIEQFAVTPGTQTAISISMKNTAEIRGFQFDLYLPEGVTVVKSPKGRIQGALSAGRLPEDDEHDLTFSVQPDGAIRFLCSSQYDETFTGNDGEIATLQVTIAENMADGNYPVVLKHVKLTESDISKFYVTEEVETTMSVLSTAEVKKGDVNNDGYVNAADVTLLARYIVGLEPSLPNEAAAYVNEDNKIDIADVAKLITLF